MVQVWLLQMYVCLVSKEMPTTGNVKMVGVINGAYLTRNAWGDGKNAQCLNYSTIRRIITEMH